jgi:hypothetical protein
MKRNTVYGLGLFVAAAALSISCSDGESGNDNGGNAGSSTSGASTGGTPGASGNSSGGNSTSGASTAGNTSSGSTNGGSTNGGSNNPQGGEDNGPDPQGGGGPGGAECPATQPEDDSDCDRPFNAPDCEYGDVTCECDGFGNNRSWSCDEDGGGMGGGGPGGGLMVDCGDNPMDGGDCEDNGICMGNSGCFCFNGMLVGCD